MGVIMKFKPTGHFTAYRGLPKEIYILFLTRIISCIGSFIIPLLTLILTQKLRMSKTEAGNFSALLILTQAPCLFLGGKLVDTVGRKKILVSCQVLGSLFYIICGITANHTVMLLSIVIASDLLTAGSPAFPAMLADLTTLENRKSSFSLLYLGINIGMAISPIFSGLLFKDYLQLLFILDGATTLTSTLIILLFVRESGEMRPPTDTAAERETAGGSETVLSVLKSAPILFAFILFMFIYHFTYTQWGFMLPLQFGDLYGGNGALFYSYANMLNAAIVVACTPLLTRLTMRFHPLAVISGGGILYFLAFVAFGLVKSVPLFLLAGAIFTFAEIVVTINLGTFISDRSPSAHLGRINSISMFTEGSARALAPLVMGHVLALTDYFVSWLLIAALMLTGAASMLFLCKKEQQAAVRPAVE